MYCQDDGYDLNERGGEQWLSGLSRSPPSHCREPIFSSLSLAKCSLSLIVKPGFDVGTLRDVKRQISVNGTIRNAEKLPILIQLVMFANCACPA
jgi:hypothetical protein